jgi:hypothetical protein
LLRKLAAGKKKLLIVGLFDGGISSVACLQNNTCLFVEPGISQAPIITHAQYLFIE